MSVLVGLEVQLGLPAIWLIAEDGPIISVLAAVSSTVSTGIYGSQEGTYPTSAQVIRLEGYMANAEAGRIRFERISIVLTVAPKEIPRICVRVASAVT